MSDSDNHTFIMDEPHTADRILGIDLRLRPAFAGVREATMSQRSYAAHVVAYYKTLVDAPVRSCHTPAASDQLANIGVMDSPPGALAPYAPRLIGMLPYLMRGSRAELAVALGVLGSYVTKWSEECDKAMHHVMSYLNTHGNVVVTFVNDEPGLQSLFTETVEDSDHAGDKATSRSISGATAFVVGPSKPKHCLGGSQRRCAASASAQAMSR